MMVHTPINLTPHEVNLVGDDGTSSTIFPSGKIASVSVRMSAMCVAGVTPIGRRTYGDIQDLPQPVDGVALIVSRVVAEAVRQNCSRAPYDLLVPTDFAFDDAGRILGARAFEMIC